LTSNITYDDNDKCLINLANETKKFIRKHPNIIFTRADKGNTTVAIEKDDYINKMMTMLNDQDTYSCIDKNPVKKLETDLNNTLKRWLNNNYITKQKYYTLISSDLDLPKAYGIPKIHKKDFPYRIIVSTINSPLHKIANYIHNILNNCLPKPRSFVKNSFQVQKALSNFSIDNEFSLCSFDVVSLFTNTPIDLAIIGLNNRWSYIKKETDIPQKEFINMIQFILNSSYFKFNNKIYKQTFGTPMGSPLSPIISDIVLQDIENKVLHRIKNNILFYHRYVDDIICAAKHSEIIAIQNLFNSFHNRIKFTIEREKNNSISFLDIKLIRINNKIITDWFHKSTFSGRYLSFYSNHPTHHKIGTIFSLIDRALLLSDPIYYNKNITFCIELLLDNGYPLEFIFKHINIRIKKIIYDISNDCNYNTNPTSTRASQRKFIGFPYVKCLSQHIKKSFKNTEFTPGYACLNRLDKFIKLHKDITDHNSKNNIIYKIMCKDCDASYVGQTKRKLNTRIIEHKRNIKQSNLSVVSRHIIDMNHDMDWNDVRILDCESNYYKRLISETIHIKQQKNSLNLIDDIDLLDKAYFPILDKINKI
jgi:hypothetical protein